MHSSLPRLYILLIIEIVIYSKVCFFSLPVKQTYYSSRFGLLAVDKSRAALLYLISSSDESKADLNINTW